MSILKIALNFSATINASVLSLTENKKFRSPQLREAAERYLQGWETCDEFNNLMQQMINFIFVELWKNYADD